MTQLSPPSHIKKGDHIRVHTDPAAEKPDWRVMGHEGLWEVSDFTTKQYNGEDTPQLLIKLKSVKRDGGVAFITLPYTKESIELVESAPEPKEPVFPEAGSQVYIKEGGITDGLWEIQKAKMEMLESGAEKLQLNLKSVDRKNLTYINIAFNAATMKPVMPAGYDAHKLDVATKRVTNVFKPLNLKR